MAYVGVPEWTPDEVVLWIQGLDNTIRPYVHAFLNNDIDGRRLVMLTSDDLYNLNIWKLGHQEIILDAVEHLSTSYFHLDIENLQWLALRLSCKARSLYNELPVSDVDDGSLQKQKTQDHVATKTLSAVADIINSVKLMVSWLNRPPFESQTSYNSLRSTMLQLSVELAMNALRDKFAEEPNRVIKNVCFMLDKMCIELIQESRDPLILQPASLDVATIRKKPNEELGMHILCLFSGSHIIASLKYQSPASSVGRVERGDEIVQVNYQTVVGWTLKKLVAAMKENLSEVVLTLKKRPKHSTSFGRIFPQHFLFAAKRTNSQSHRQRNVLSSKKENHKQRPVTLKDSSQILPPLPVIVPSQTSLCAVNKTLVGTATRTTAAAEAAVEDEDDDDDSAFLSEVEACSSTNDVHLSVPKMQVALQRRATVTGASPTASRPPVTIDQLWHDSKRDGINRSYSYDISGHGVAAAVETSRLISTGSHEKGASVLSVMPQIVTNGNKHLKASVSSVECIDAAIKTNTKQEKDLLKEEVSFAAQGCQKSDRYCQANLMPLHVKFLDDAVKQLKNVQQMNKASVTQSFSETDTEKKPLSSCLSYQVVVVGGVAQKCSSLPKESKQSPLASPRLRNKIKRWHFASRRVSCKDLGQGDCEGWLYRGFHRKGALRSGHKWSKRWCVVVANGLYVYVDRESLKAECLIYLVGFSICPAPECKSKKFAFKVYHSGTDFYFASDSQISMSKWMNKMSLAAIAFDSKDVSPTKFNLSATHSPTTSESLFYSESEDETESTEGKVLIREVSDESESSSLSSLTSVSSYPSVVDSPVPSVMESQFTANEQLISDGDSTQSSISPCSFQKLDSLQENSLTSQSCCDVNVPEASVKMSLAFEMNLDTSPVLNCDSDAKVKTNSTVSSSNRPLTSNADASKSLTVSALKLFGSPRFVKKFGGHHRGRSDSSKYSDKGRSVWFGGDDSDDKLPTDVTNTSTIVEKRLFGSPRLARAFLRAIQHKKVISAGSDLSTTEKTTGESCVVSKGKMESTSSILDYRVMQSVRISSIPSYPDNVSNIALSSSCCSPLTSSGCESTESDKSLVEVPRTLLKPAMGISMIGKQRRSSSNHSDSRASQSSYHGQPLFTSMATQGTQTENG